MSRSKRAGIRAMGDRMDQSFSKRAQEASQTVTPYEVGDEVRIAQTGKTGRIKQVHLRGGPYYFLEEFPEDQFFTHAQLELI